MSTKKVNNGFEKIHISANILKDIIDKRKNLKLSAQALSMQSAHKKYWLTNIEGKKIKFITMEDLVSIYTVLLPDISRDEIVEYINEMISDSEKKWYERVEETDLPYDEEDLYNKKGLVSLNAIGDVDTAIIDLIESLTSVLEFEATKISRNDTEKSIILSSLRTFLENVRSTPELTFMMLNVPLYAFDEISEEKQYQKVVHVLADLNSDFSKQTRESNYNARMNAKRNVDGVMKEYYKNKIEYIKSTFMWLIDSMISKELGIEEGKKYFIDINMELMDIIYSSDSIEKGASIEQLSINKDLYNNIISFIHLFSSISPVYNVERIKLTDDQLDSLNRLLN